MATAPSLDRLLRAKGDLQRSLARRIVARGVPWKDWGRRFGATVVTSPETGERAAHALEVAAHESGDQHAVARLRLLRGIALQRSGSPDEASQLFLQAEPDLRAYGDHDQAVQSLLFAVDALGHAGEIDEALRCAERARARIRGPRAPLFRALLRGNRANVLRLAGRLAEAASESDKAARALERLGQAPSAAAARLNAAVALMYAGHVSRARTRFESARALFESVGHDDRVLHADYNLACLDVRAGDPGAGIQALESLAAQAQTRGLRRHEALCRMDLSDALRRAGDLGTAAREAEAAVAAFVALRAGAEEIEARWLAAAALFEQDVGAARKHLTQARKRAAHSGRSEYVLRSAVLDAEFELRRGRRPDARALAGLQRRATTLGQDEIAWQVHLLRVEAALTSGVDARARKLLDALPKAASRHPWIETAATVARARLDIKCDDLALGIRRLRRLTTKLDRIRGGLPGAWLQTTFLLDRLDPYLLLVDALLARGGSRDRREAEEVLDNLALKRFLSGKSPRGIRGRVATLRRRLELLYDRLAEGGGTTRGLNPSQRAAMLHEVRSLERQVADAWRQGERAGANERAVRGRVAAARPTDSYLHLWVRDDDVRALLRRGGTVTNFGVLARVSDLRKQSFEIQFHAHRVRATGSASAERALNRALVLLSGALLGPLSLDLTARRRVRLVLDSRLPDLPWEMLPLHGRPLAAQTSLARVPAARLPRQPGTRAQGTRVLVSGERELTAIAREARHVAGGGHVLRGAAATRLAAAQALCECSVVHLAMHGVAAPHAPALGGVRLSDGWFTAADMPDRVSADLVSLAACQTGAPPSPEAQAWGALPHALLRAGVRWVLWTSGDVDDETTADLMSAFHPVSDIASVPEMLGQALERVATRQGTPARLLPFRLSGGLS